MSSRELVSSNSTEAGALVSALHLDLLRSDDRRPRRLSWEGEDRPGLTARNGLAREAAPAHAATVNAVPRAQPTLARRQLWERSYRKRLMMTDAGIVALVTALAALLGLGLMASSPLVYLGVHLSTALTWLLMLGAFQSRNARLIGSGSAEYTRLLQATSAAFGLLAILYTVFAWEGHLRTQVLVAFPLGVVALLGGRWRWRTWLHRQRLAGLCASRALLVGERKDVTFLAQSLSRDHGRSMYTIVGAALGSADTDDVVTESTRIPVIGDRESVADLAREVGADTIIVAGRPEQDPDYVKRLGWQLEGTAAELVLSSQIADVAGPRISLTHVDGLPLIRVRIPTFEGADHAMKRAADVCLSLLALIPIAMLTPLIALFLRLDSPGPVFFRQERVGCDGRTFRMLKFRSMSVTAEEDLAKLKAQNEGSGVLFKMKHDPRVTRVGRILRKYSLDELPQFWNVLIGDMSIVGPRPPLPSEVLEYDGTVWRRLFIKPGITGLWQISGRSDLSWEESVRLDLRYVENWSVMSDFVIMLRTARAIFTSNGAY